MKAALFLTTFFVSLGLMLYGQMAFHVQDIPYFKKIAWIFAVCTGLIVLYGTFANEKKWLSFKDASFWKRVETHAICFFGGCAVSLIPLSLFNGCVKAVNLTHTLSVHQEQGTFEGVRMGSAGGRPVVLIRKIVIRLDSVDHEIKFPVGNGVYEDFKAGEKILVEYKIGLLGLMKGIKIRHVKNT